MTTPHARHQMPDAADSRDRRSPSTQNIEHVQVTAFAHAMVAMAITDLDGRVLASNDALGELLLLSPADLVGSSLFAVTHAADVARAEAACRSLTDSDVRTSVVEVRLVRSDDACVHVKVSTSKVVDADGEASHLVMHLQDVSDHVTTTATLRRMAFHDPLTGLANRALLEDRLEHAVQRHRRDASPVSILVIDLDDFKTINDTRGHEVGDEVLRTVARELTLVVRADTTVARIGGDEFVVVCEAATHSVAQQVAERIAEALHRSPRLSAMTLTVSASIGIATADSLTDHGEQVEQLRRRLIDAADADMYRRKRARRSTVDRTREA